MTNLSSDLTTNNVSTLDVDLDGEAATITVDADATTVTVSSITDNDTNIVLGNDTATAVNISGTANTNDVASITGNGTVTLDVSEAGGAQDVELTRPALLTMLTLIFLALLPVVTASTHVWRLHSNFDEAPLRTLTRLHSLGCRHCAGRRYGG